LVLSLSFQGSLLLLLLLCCFPAGICLFFACCCCCCCGCVCWSIMRPFRNKGGCILPYCVHGMDSFCRCVRLFVRCSRWKRGRGCMGGHRWEGRGLGGVWGRVRCISIVGQFFFLREVGPARGGHGRTGHGSVQSSGSLCAVKGRGRRRRACRGDVRWGRGRGEEEALSLEDRERMVIHGRSAA